MFTNPNKNKFKVICVDNKSYVDLGEKDYVFSDIEIGKMYDVEFFGNEMYKVYLEDGEITAHWCKFFMTLAEWRDKQINSILTDEDTLQENT
jgi:hypothetical protein